MALYAITPVPLGPRRTPHLRRPRQHRSRGGPDNTGLVDAPKHTGLTEAPKDTGLMEVAKRAGGPPYETPENRVVAKRASTTRPSATHLRIELTSPRAKELRHSRVEAASPYGKKGQKERGKRRGKKSTLRRGCISGQLQANTMRYKLRMRDKSCPAMTSGNIH